jgi:hypothetical protein
MHAYYSRILACLNPATHNLRPVVAIENRTLLHSRPVTTTEELNGCSSVLNSCQMVRLTGFYAIKRKEWAPKSYREYIHTVYVCVCARARVCLCV